MLAHTTISFDIAGLEIYLPLITGASIVLSPHHITVDTPMLIRYIRQHKISYIQATPALWQMLINAGWTGDSALTLLAGGEALSIDLARKLISHGATVWNVYGPTEATIWCSVYRVPEEQVTTMSIGKQIANTQFYVLDRHKRVAPLGVPGELYIGGDCLTQGYWNRPDLNEEKFYYFNSGGIRLRLYRTGDLVKYLADGNLIYLGRLDRQIKLRGFRIEPGEIEYHLRQFPGIEEAIVTTKQINPNDIRLVAYLLTKIQFDEAGCRQYLQQRLPIHMIPNIFVILTSAPLTANGKIDHKALPDPDWHKPCVTASVTLPDNPIQSAVMQIWMEVLGIQDLTIDSNFFALGGHSLLVTRIIGRIADEFSVELPPNELFSHPTIRELSALIENSQPSHRQTIIPLKDTDRLIVPATLQQHYMMFKVHHLPEPENAAMNNVFVVCEINGSLEAPRLKNAFKKIFKRHHILSSYFRFGQHKMELIYDDKLKLPFKTFNFSDLPRIQQSSQVDEIINSDKCKVFNLSKGPLWRCCLMKLSDNKFILYFNMHHLIFDGASTYILFKELSDFYNNDIETIDPSPIQYADYAMWQHNWLKEGNLDKLKAHWQTYLTNVPKRLVLRDSLLTGAEMQLNLAEYEFSITEKTVFLLKEFCTKEKISLFPLLMASYIVVLYRHSEEKDMVVSYHYNNRHYKNVERMMGLLASTLPMRIKINPHSTFKNLLTDVRGDIIANFMYPYLPIESLLKPLNIKDMPDYHPIFQMLFNFVAEPLLFKLVNTQIKLLRYPYNFSKYDQWITAFSSGNQLNFILRYKKALYSPEKIVEITEDIKRILAQVAHNPNLLIKNFCKESR